MERITFEKSLLNTEISNINSDITYEREKRKAKVQKIKQTIEDAMVGNLNLEAMGLTWIFLGTILVTIPVEIEKIIKWILKPLFFYL